jgi:ribosomal protein L40E
MSTPPATPTGLTHACARCGAPVPLDVGLCERCNPLGLRDAASSQVHGTVFVAIGLAVVGLAIVAMLAVSGIGPFPAEVVAVRPDGDALSVSVRVTNEGTSLGSTTCRLSDPESEGGKAALVLSPRIAAGATITFDSRVTEFGGDVRPLAVECSKP